MTPPPTLAAIAALARSGAVERGWALFVAQGHDRRGGDPAALTVKGRLLKGRARIAEGATRGALFAQAADAYGAAHALGPAPYLAINAATARLLAGDPARAQAEARAVLALLDAAQPLIDTPYFIAATRAEALLLLGDEAGARSAMAEAAKADPDGWADRAVTLAQLREVALAQGAEFAWLADFAPPASLHFSGHLGIAAGGASEAELAGLLAPLLDQRRSGFAWGALAAGADIVIAEQLLARGIALHAVLPCPPDKFAAQSVRPAGEAWARRYDALLGAAASVRWAGDAAAPVHDPLATALAGELAIGAAILNARAQDAPAWQLIVTDPQGGGPNTARQAELWRPSAGEQVHLQTPRDAEVEALFPPEAPDPARALAVHLAVSLDGLDGLRSEAIARHCAPVSEALGTLPRHLVRAAAPGRWEALVDDPLQARSLMQTMLHAARTADLPPPAIGAHLAISIQVPDPASGAVIPFGPGMPLARRLCAMAPAGSSLISDALAVTLTSREADPVCQLYHAGDDEFDGPVHTLSS